MAFGPQRRHLVASLAVAVHALSLQQHLMVPNLLVLSARVFTQIQINAPATLHPDKSLTTMSMLVFTSNAIAMFFHYIAFVAGVQRGSGVLIDFVGHTASPSFLRVLGHDVTISGLQFICVIVSYVSLHSHAQSPSSSELLPSDLLLPRDEEDRDIFQLESGERKDGSHESDETDLFIDKIPKTAMPALVLTLSLSHAAKLILSYPSPAAPDIVPGRSSAASEPSLAASQVGSPRAAVPGIIPGQWLAP